MLSFLSNWKLYLLSFTLIGALSLNVLQRYKTEKLESRLQVCEGNAMAMQVAINAASEMRADLERKLRVREQEAAKAQAETQKRMESINNAAIPDDCNEAVAWGVEHSKTLKFHWKNNTP
jgi:hypothetical protein